MTTTTILRRCILSLLSLAVAACGGSSEGTGGAGGAPGACNTLANVGQVVSETIDANALPAMSGGTIVDGTYVLVSNVEYGASAPGSKTHKRTLEIAGDTVQIVNSDDGGPDIHATLKLAPSGNELNETAACPVGLSYTPGTYTATATSLAIQKHGTTQVETYEKQ